MELAALVLFPILAVKACTATTCTRHRCNTAPAASTTRLPVSQQPPTPDSGRQQAKRPWALRRPRRHEQRAVPQADCRQRGVALGLQEWTVSPSAGASNSSGAALGSRQRAFVPMTPRSVGNAQADFARQMAERNQALRPQKKHKTSVPKGSKLAAGYVDRAQQRQDEAGDDREERLKELDQALKSGEIDRETYDKRRFDIAGGSLDSTHLVKGLDFKLLERIRRGEDVYGNKPKNEPAEDEEPAEDDIDEAFNDLEHQEVHAIEREKTQKKGQFSTVAVEPGKKRSRNQILAELKAAREAAKAQQQSSLGSKFKKIGGAKQKPGTRIERDAKGREVLIIVDEDGNEKRKVRKLQAVEDDEPAEPKQDLSMPDPTAKPLGMEVPEEFRKREIPEEDKDFDIFAGVGDDYDPLAGMDGSDSDSSGSDEEKPKKEPADKPRKSTDAAMMPPPPKPAGPAAPRNYFQGLQDGSSLPTGGQGPVHVGRGDDGGHQEGGGAAADRGRGGRQGQGGGAGDGGAAQAAPSEQRARRRGPRHGLRHEPIRG
ncbi:hypothetical protein ACCO45_003600 [Purpureocillium lilacinum]|uniref:Uncharacterized protein n=1 Tax=Purpureocillium lilacinum TaxID=33203 RepID=A0ACC4E0C4_PURLI